MQMQRAGSIARRVARRAAARLVGAARLARRDQQQPDRTRSRAGSPRQDQETPPPPYYEVGSEERGGEERTPPSTPLQSTPRPGLPWRRWGRTPGLSPVQEARPASPAVALPRPRPRPNLIELEDEAEPGDGMEEGEEEPEPELPRPITPVRVGPVWGPLRKHLELAVLQCCIL